MNLFEFLAYCNKNQLVNIYYNNHLYESGVCRFIIGDFELTDFKVEYFEFKNEVLHVEVNL